MKKYKTQLKDKNSFSINENIIELDNESKQIKWFYADTISFGNENDSGFEQNTIAIDNHEYGFVFKILSKKVCNELIKNLIKIRNKLNV